MSALALNLLVRLRVLRGNPSQAVTSLALITRQQMTQQLKSHSEEIYQQVIFNFCLTLSFCIFPKTS